MPKVSGIWQWNRTIPGIVIPEVRVYFTADGYDFNTIVFTKDGASGGYVTWKMIYIGEIWAVCNSADDNPNEIVVDSGRRVIEFAYEQEVSEEFYAYLVANAKALQAVSVSEKLALIAENEQKVYNAGYEKGKSEGGDTDAAYEQGYENGYNDGNLLYYATSLEKLFQTVTFPENFELIAKVKSVPNIGMAFLGAKNLKSIKLISEDKDAIINASYAFRECKQLEIVDLMEFGRKFSNVDYCFYGSSIKTILGALDLSNCTSIAGTSFHCVTLEEVEIVPNTIYVSIRFSSAKLTEASKESIINGLADLTGKEPQTITLNGVGANLTAEQKARIAAKNWTLAY